jgi:DNA-binding transcriptional LysR family regulator
VWCCDMFKITYVNTARQTVHRSIAGLVAALVLLRALDLVAHPLNQRADGLSAHPLGRVRIALLCPPSHAHTHGVEV